MLTLRRCRGAVESSHSLVVSDCPAGRRTPLNADPLGGESEGIALEEECALESLDELSVASWIGDRTYKLGSGITSGNTVSGNGGFGLSLHSTAGYRDNVITDNATGTVEGGVNAGGNVCDGSLTCP